MVAAWQSVAQQCDSAFDELTRLATYRLEANARLVPCVRIRGMSGRAFASVASEASQSLHTERRTDVTVASRDHEEQGTCVVT